MEDIALKNVWAYTYIPLTLLGDGVWGVWIYRIKGASVFRTKYKKRIYQRKSIRKIISQCVCLLYPHTYPRALLVGGVQLG